MPPKKKAADNKAPAQTQKNSKATKKSKSPSPAKPAKTTGRQTRNKNKTKSKSKSKSPSPPPAKTTTKRGRGRQAAPKQKSPSPSPPPTKAGAKRGRSKKTKSKSKSKSPSPAKKQDTKKSDTNLAKTASTDSVRMEKIIVKGQAAVDKYCPGSDSKHVYSKGGKVYACTLNQSNLNANNNKFYIIQCLQSDTNSSQFFVFNRWGRVGVQGQQALMGPFGEPQAISAYEKKFNDKTRKGDYIEVHINYGDDNGEEEKEQNEKMKEEQEQQKEQVQSKLEKSVQNLIDMIFDTKLMDQAMKEIGYDSKKMPLGKLADATINQGYEILKKLLEAIQKNEGKQTYADLSGQFFSTIPHDFGFSKMISHIIDNEEKVKAKLNMLQSLTDMKLTTKLLSQKTTSDQNIIDQNYEKLKCQIKPLDKSKKEEWKIIDTFVNNTRENWKVDLKDIWEVEREGEAERYDTKIGNDILLWHGSRVTNYGGILSQGLRIAPPEAPVSGYLYGKGIYFADQFSKSAHYCRGTGTDILIMLCDVAVGKPNVLQAPDYNAANLPPGCHSAKGFGNMAPPERSYVKLPGTNVQVPQGKPMRTTSSNYQGHNEFIVYNLSQVRIRYLLRIGLNY